MKCTILLIILNLLHVSSGERIIVSGYSSSLATYNVTDDRRLEPDQEWQLGQAGRDMSWLQVEGDTIWAGHEVGEYEGDNNSVVSRWKVSADGTSLERLEYAGTGSVYTAHLKVDKFQERAYSANYGGNSLSIIHLTENGTLGELDGVYNYGENCTSHPHQTFTREYWMWVVDLGCDRIYHYLALRAGGVARTGIVTEVRAGAGPRHAVMHPTRNLMFLLCELQSYVMVYSYKETTGMFDLLQELELSSTETDAGAEILVGPSGQFVYASSRGTGVVVVYRLEEEDSLVRVQEFSLAGTWPRSMTIRGDIMLVTDKVGSTVQLLEIAQDTGMLSGDPNKVYSTPTNPTFVDFMD